MEAIKIDLRPAVLSEHDSGDDNVVHYYIGERPKLESQSVCNQ